MKEKIKLVIVFILGIMISVVISVYAATVISAGEVSYTDNKGIGTSNVQDAINGVYTSANSIASRVTALEGKTSYTKLLDSKSLSTTVSNYTLSGDIFNYKMLIIVIKFGTTYRFSMPLIYPEYTGSTHWMVPLMYDLAQYYEMVNIEFVTGNSIRVSISKQGTNSTFNNSGYITIYGVS